MERREKKKHNRNLYRRRDDNVTRGKCAFDEHFSNAFEYNISYTFVFATFFSTSVLFSEFVGFDWTCSVLDGREKRNETGKKK